MSAMKADREGGSIPLVLLAAIVLGGIIIALFTDVTTGRRLAVADRDFHQAVQLADAGLQEALVLLDSPNDAVGVDLPEVGQEFPEPFTAALHRGEYVWNARRTGSWSWEIRSVGMVGGRQRVLEASIAQDAPFDAAAFGDQFVRMGGGNVANSYLRHEGNACTQDTGLGYIASNHSIDVNPNQDIDGVLLYGGADYSKGNAPLVGSHTDKRQLANIAKAAYEEGGACWGEDVHVLDVLPPELEAGATYCVRQAEFPKDATDLSGQSDEPTIIYIKGDGDLTLQGQGGGSGGASEVNVSDAPCPNAAALQIYLDHGRVRFGNHSKIAAGIYAPNSTCRGNPSAAQATVYGSLICGSIGDSSSGNQGGWSFYYDQAMGAIASGPPVLSGIREEHTSTTSFSSGNTG